MNAAQNPEGLLLAAVTRLFSRTTGGIVFGLEKPENPAHGDYATNAALKFAPQLRRAPMMIAEEIALKLRKDSALCKIVDRIHVAPPGFVNFFLSPEWLAKEIVAIVQKKEKYGKMSAKKREKIQIEFISANPTGPLTLANGRGGFLGDALAHVLEAAGHNVTREYYINDAGAQVEKLGWSVLAAVGYPTPFAPEDLYRGGYVQEIAKKISVPPPKGELHADAKLAQGVTREAVKVMLADIKRVARKAGIDFDVWFSERSLHRQGFVDEIMKMLKRKRLLEEREGAKWLRAQELGELKDRVVVKSNGEPTYLLPDLAYHYEKFARRKFSRVIDIFGADHHGNAKALKAGLRALGISEPEVILVQFVRLADAGEIVKMSKRAGTFVTLEELLDEVGLDVARWFFLERAAGTHMEFDLALAKERSEKNPVFYVQYAHARCVSILRRAEEQGRGGKKHRNVSLEHSSELVLAKELIRFPDLIQRIAKNYEVHHLPTYATTVATAFSSFYRDCKVITDNAETTASRLMLVHATKIALANTLGLLGIRAPEKM